MEKAVMTFLLQSIVLLAVVARPVSGQEPPPRPLLEEGQKLFASGDIAAAVDTLQRAVAAAPQSVDARLALGRALDLDGRHADARTHLEQALSLAAGAQRTSALTALAVSYAFESRAEDAARYYERAFDADRQANDRAAAAARANALGRIYLESGSLDKARHWYTTGYETAKEIPDLPAGQAALWEMRYQNALGRIAARRGDFAAARKHADAVKTLLSKIDDRDQQAFYPYLTGYIALFAKDYRQAVAELSQGDQSDPFVLGLMAQAYQKLGDNAQAAEYFRKVLAVPAHNINGAFSRPLARAFLKGVPANRQP